MPLIHYLNRIMIGVIGCRAMEPYGVDLTFWFHKYGCWCRRISIFIVILSIISIVICFFVTIGKFIFLGYFTNPLIILITSLWGWAGCHWFWGYGVFKEIYFDPSVL